MNTNYDSFVFLCRTLSPFAESVNAGRLINLISSGSISWESVVGIANSHLVISALWSGLLKKKMDGEMEAYVRDYLEELYKLNLNRNHQLKRQAFEVIGILNSIDIHPLLIKGASQLFQPFHGDMGSRIMTDLDMWVPADQIANAVTALKAVGYCSDTGTHLKPDHHHVAPLFRKGEYGSVELHHEVIRASIAPVLDASAICKASENRLFQGVQYRTPSPTHALLLNMLHSQVGDGYHYKWIIGLKPLNDMVAMVSHFNGLLDWDEIETRMAHNRLNPVFRAFLWSAHRLFDFPLPAGVRPSPGTFAHHAFCMAAIRWRTADKITVKMDRYRKSIHRRLGGFENYFRYAA